LVALATMNRDTWRLDRAREYARRLVEISPADADARAACRARFSARPLTSN
jgi:hypothetical protein